MASRECASCHTQINTCDVCGADWPSHMMDPAANGTAPALMVCESDWTTIRVMLGLYPANVLDTVTRWRNAHPQDA